LIAPFDLVISEGTGYFAFAQENRFGEPKIAAFLDWLRAEVAADETSGALIPNSSPRAA
jgi:hypothetical protein